MNDACGSKIFFADPKITRLHDGFQTLRVISGKVKHLIRRLRTIFQWLY